MWEDHQTLRAFCREGLHQLRTDPANARLAGYEIKGLFDLYFKLGRAATAPTGFSSDGPVPASPDFDAAVQQVYGSGLNLEDLLDLIKRAHPGKESLIDQKLNPAAIPIPATSNSGSHGGRDAAPPGSAHSLSGASTDANQDSEVETLETFETNNSDVSADAFAAPKHSEGGLAAPKSFSGRDAAPPGSAHSLSVPQGGSQVAQSSIHHPDHNSRPQISKRSSLVGNKLVAGLGSLTENLSSGNTLVAGSGPHSATRTSLMGQQDRGGVGNATQSSNQYPASTQLAPRLGHNLKPLGGGSAASRLIPLKPVPHQYDDESRVGNQSPIEIPDPPILHPDSTIN